MCAIIVFFRYLCIILCSFSTLILLVDVAGRWLLFSPW